MPANSFVKAVQAAVSVGTGPHALAGYGLRDTQRSKFAKRSRPLRRGANKIGPHNPRPIQRGAGGARTRDSHTNFGWEALRAQQERDDCRALRAEAYSEEALVLFKHNFPLEL